MQGSNKIPIIDLNRHITCKLCKGYFIDATTICECLHTFCRSCIVRYLEKTRYCPICEVQVHKTKPLLNIRPDKTLQDIVYKLVPRLFQNEMQRRRDFFSKHPESRPSCLEQCGEAYQHLLTPEETIYLTLSYHGSNKPRYLRCPAAVSLGHLKKLIRAKYDLNENHRVDILYNQDCLSPSLTLVDVAYIYLWKRKGPLDLTYRIYECTAKKLKLDTEQAESNQTDNNVNNNNNNWKEVQLRISENGEMSITGIQDSLSPSLLEIVNSEPKYKTNDVITVADSKSVCAKKELPGLKYIGKSTSTETVSVQTTASTSTGSANSLPVANETAVTSMLAIEIPASTVYETRTLDGPVAGNATICATLSSATTTTVYSTINSSKCSTKSDDVPSVSDKPTDVTENVTNSIVNNNICDKNLKRKNENVAETEPPIKQPKQTILNHSIGLLNLSSNHPLKKHSKLNRNGENIVKESLPKVVIISESQPMVKASTATAVTDVTFSKPSFVNKNVLNAHVSRPGTPITSKAPMLAIKSTTPPKQPVVMINQVVKSPCYMPKSTYSPVLNVPKPVTSTCNNTKIDNKHLPVTSIGVSLASTKVDSKTVTANCSQQQSGVANANNKPIVKSKPSTPIGYKTLRDPPKSWNSQISKANLTKTSPDPKYSDMKNAKPAKFFKMRNNIPRYLGNPASGVKPMYQVHVSPEKEKPQEFLKLEKSEIRKHSIVKIDPKTLKPISEKAPETTSLSNHSTSNQNNHTLTNQGYSNVSNNQNDLKINTSSVSIFNPLKLQSSPKNERKSPKSPHSPKVKSNSSPTGSKREKVNLNFTPPNPFIPNLTSPTMSPNQFLYPSGPSGFPPPYDPRVMAAYHSMWYGQRMPFGNPAITGLSLDLNQRKNFDMMSPPTSPKMSIMSQQVHNPQIAMKLASTISTSISSMSRPHSLTSSTHKPTASSRKTSKESKSEKSIENAVEKLTQNRHKEVSVRIDALTKTSIAKSTNDMDIEFHRRLEPTSGANNTTEPQNVLNSKGKENDKRKGDCVPTSSCSETVAVSKTPRVDKSKSETNPPVANRIQEGNDSHNNTSAVSDTLDKSQLSGCKSEANSATSKLLTNSAERSKTPVAVKPSEISERTATVSEIPNSSVKKSSCIDRGKEEMSGSNSVTSKNSNNVTSNHNSEEIVKGDK